MTAFPSFADFFAAARGVQPFPWQRRLADEVMQHGWPGLLALPTGSGKTTTLDIALWSLAAAPLRMPRRTVLVVDRRVVVDQGAKAARDLLRAMRDATDGPLRAVADALRATYGAEPDDAPFAVAVMRGGMPRDNDWARRPDQPVLGVSTVDQVGSRLLFRGYGIADRSLSIHAGLLGEDTLILLDEVHLSEPFAQTLEAIEGRLRGGEGLLPRRFRSVMLSATPGTATNRTRFELDEADWTDPVLGSRLHAQKAARLRQLKVPPGEGVVRRQAYAERLAEAAVARLGNGDTVGVVVNRVALAQDVASALRNDAPADVGVILLTGRMRPLEREILVQRELMPRVGPRSDRADGARRTIVVATQCIEAGADLDFDALVTECASIDTLRQRVGGLDRVGARGRSVADIIRPDQLDDDDPVYGSALKATWEALSEIAVGGEVPFGIEEFPAGLMTDASLRPPTRNAPVLMPAHVEALAQTSPVADYAPDVAPYLHGPEERPADVQLVWRADLDVPSPEADLDVALADAIARLNTMPPSALEAVGAPVWVARALLQRETPEDGADAPMIPPQEPRRWSREQAPIVALRWRGESSAWVTPRDMRPGDVLVLPAAHGGLRDGMLAPEDGSAVVDVAEAAHWVGRGRAALRLDPRTLAWLGAGLPLPDLDREAYETMDELRQAVGDWLGRLPEDPPPMFPLDPGEFTAWRRALTTRGFRVVFDPSPTVLGGTRGAGHQTAGLGTEEDSGNTSAVHVTIARHSEDVAAFATRFAASLGMPPAIIDDLERAAVLHDAGKADPRFQALLLGGDEDAAALLPAPLAKSPLVPGRQQPSGLRALPKGARHELLSVRLAEGTELLQAASDPDLVLHLVASHHGWARPFAPPVSDADERLVSVTLRGATLTAPVAHGFGDVGDGLPERFAAVQARYGAWGLAWLEALMRLADHRASEGNA